MTTDTISYKKELLLAQIENFTNSGFFTENEIDKLCAPIYNELAMLECCEAYNSLTSNTEKGVKSFEELKEKFLSLVKIKKHAVENIDVVTPEFLTSNNLPA